MDKKIKIAIIGLGYVGLPLALEFSKKRKVIGFDIDNKRVLELVNNYDRTNEASEFDLENSKKNLELTSDENYLKKCNFYIVATPTPINKCKDPDLSLLISATKMVARYIKPGDIIVYESTVFPGCTEEICVPIIESVSNLKFNKHFFCGYSPERINPGDKKRSLRNIVKLVSGSTEYVCNVISAIYEEVIDAGIYKAKSIMVAEAAKVIENTQRDLNIALINELSIIFNKLGIDTTDVLNAAKTKWNFIDFKPGLVGGHCIGVDPYYLTFKAESLGYTPQIILSGRRLNDEMSSYVANLLIKKMIRKKINLSESKILIMGTTFKEDCNDIRNSKVFDLYNHFVNFGCKVSLFDPICNKDEVYQMHNIKMLKILRKNTYDAILLAVPHKEIKDMGIKSIKMLARKNHVFFDMKASFNKKYSDLRL